MKVLVFDEWLPWPLESGKKIRSYNLLVRLAKYHQIVYFAYVRLPSEQYKIDLFSTLFYKVIPIIDTRTEKWTIPYYIAVIKNMFSNKPFSTYYHITENYLTKLKETVDNEKPDMIHCEWTNLAPCLQYLDKIPCVISAHNVESDIWKRLYSNTSNLLKKYVAKQQAHRIELLEKYWYPRADICIAVSQQDQQVIKSYGANAILVENGVDIDYYRYKEIDYDMNSLIFTASFDTFSNQDGAEYFVSEIYPIIKKNNPRIKLFLVGKDPTQKIRSYSENDKSIIVTGSVPDVRPFIAKSSVCVVPLRIGGGSRLKILEAFAMKKPVVSTTIGAEGLSIVNGQNILLADDPHTFAERVLEILKMSPVRDSLVNSGFGLVEKYYDWDILSEVQHQTWQKSIQ